MKYTLTILLLICLTGFAHAQTFKVRLSQKHLNKVERAKDGRSRLKKYRKFYSKDSLKQAKKEKKFWKHKSDSLLKARRKGKPGQYEEVYTKQIPKADSTLLDSAKNIAVSEAKDVAQNSPEYIKGQQKLNELKGNVDLNQLKNKDSLTSYAGNYAQQQAEDQLGQVAGMSDLQKQRVELEGLTQLQEQYKSDYGGYADPEKLRTEGKSMASEQAAAFMAQHGDKVAAIQKKISRLQRKYIKLPNSNDLSSAVKRTSLTGRTFKERLVIGGNFNINNIDPLSLDLSPQLGYRFNKRFTVGVGGTYRQTFSDSLATSPAIPADTYGFRGFSSYDVFKNFFAYGEYEQMAKEVTQADRKKTEWVDGLLIGLGREISVHPKLNMNVMVLYNFINEQENPIYGRRWVVRVGFQLSELALLKRNKL
ncbi:MAG: hypothetical protein AAFX57_16890 [Bacteroidota bacterium]